MVNRLKSIRIKRSFSEDFKRARVLEFEKGQFTVLELSKLYHICTSLIYYWVCQYSKYPQQKIRIVEMEDSSEIRIKALTEDICKLQQIVGQKQIKIDLLEQIIHQASIDLGVDIKKNGFTPPSSGSEKNPT